MHDIFSACAKLLENGEDAVMVTIIDRTGSAPRTAGSRMLVRRDGSITGTIGGGLFEAEAIRMAAEVFQSGQAAVREFRFSSSEITAMDMVCGGKAEVFVDLLRSGDAENAEVCRAVRDVKRRDRHACLVTLILTGPESAGRVKLAFMTGDGEIRGMPLPEKEREELARACTGRFPVQVWTGDARYLVEPVRYPGTVYIFGAGHVSQKLAYLTPFLGFRTVIVDDRGEFANGERFPDADEIIVTESLEHCMKDLEISGESFLVIVTRGHAYDMAVLAQALGTDAGYIGMIGSKKKREAIYKRLRESGTTEEALSRVHCPIGIAIEAETPEEIAVSIAGELIQARARLINGYA